jgi:hypothetical protein
MKNKNSFIGTWNAYETMGDSFLTACHEIVNNPEAFTAFKQNAAFCSIIANDVLGRTISDSIYDNIINDVDIMNNIEQFKTNDLYGSPNLYEYPRLGYISPGTMYFINILKDLRDKFGDLTNFDIVEIGSGYGGQAKIILDSVVKSYSMIDLKPTLDLCEHYLSLFDYENVKFQTADNIKQTSYDLVISNWCLSEFDEAGMEFYIENVIKHCNNGYFLMNSWDSRKQFFISSLKPYFSYIEEFPEFPKTHANPNWLLVIKK